MGPNLQNIMRQAKKMQEQLQRLQEDVGRRTVEGSAGGGMVVAVANGKQELISLRIEREVVDPEDVDMLQDLITAAVNQAMTKAREMMAQEMGQLTGGMGIPGLG